MADRTLLATMTGEHFQPVRLHYRVLNRSGLLRASRSFNAWITMPPGSRWVWLYGYEASSFGSSNPMTRSRGSIIRS